MSGDTDDTSQLQPDALSFDAPEPLGPAGYDALQSVLLYNVEQGLADALLGLSEQTELDLVRLAFHDTMRLDRLERVVQAAIRDRQDGEGAASRFSLGSYRRAASQVRKRLQEERARVAKLRQRNARVIQGDKDQSIGTDVEMPGGSSMTAQAMCEASGVFLRACGLLLTFRAGRVWFDSFYGNYYSDWDGTENDAVKPAKAVDDAFLLAVHGYLLMMDTRLGASSTTNTEKAIHFVADRDIRNEPRQWLQGLVWDGTERLEKVLSLSYGAPDDDYHRAVGRCWFTSMAARITWPGCKVDTMPVLFGPQGTFKSTSLEIIGGKWYATLNVSAEGKDFVGTLPGLVVGEIAELDAISGRRVENSRVKTLLSTAEDLFRPPYGRTARRFLRTVVFVGTTNDPAWHRDESGGRRFWPVNCAQSIDLQWLRDNREQLFAEARVRFERGDSWSDVPREDQERRVMEFHTADPWEDRVSAALSTWRLYIGPWSNVPALDADPAAIEESAHWGTMLTTNRVATVVLQIASERQSRATSLRIAKALRRLGWEQTTVKVKSGKVVRAWVRDDVTRNQGELSLKSEK